MPLGYYPSRTKAARGCGATPRTSESESRLARAGAPPIRHTRIHRSGRGGRATRAASYPHNWELSALRW